MKTRITRAQVLMLMKSQTVADLHRPITTHQMALILGTKEPSVRAAVMWLERADYLVKFCDFIKEPRGKNYGQQYKVGAYLWTGKTDPLCTCRRNAEEREVQKETVNAERMGGVLQDLLNQLARARA